MNPRHSALLVLVLSLTAFVRADEWAPNLTATAVWHSNATNAEKSDDQIDTLQINADLLSSQRYDYGRNDSLYLRAHLAGDWWARYNLLFSSAAGGRAEWRHQFGVDPRAVNVSVEGAADYVAARETGRRGTSAGVTASVRKRLNDLTRISLSHEVSWMFARYGVYDRAASETSLELGRDLTSATRLTFTARYRDGDIVSYAFGTRPDLAALATRQLEVATFGHAMTAYRIDAKTWSGKLALVRALSDSTAVLVGYERRETDRGSLRFSNDLLSVGFIHQF